MWTPDYFVRLLDLPAAVLGVTVPNTDGSFDIYINRRLSPQRQRDCLRHELSHIRRDHFYKGSPVPLLEAEAEGKLLNVFDISDGGSLPYFTSLDALGDYVAALTSRLRNKKS